MKDGPWTRVVWKALESSDFVFWLGLFLPRLTIRSSVYGSVFISFGASFCLCILLFYLFVVWLIVRANAVDCPDKRQQRMTYHANECLHRTTLVSLADDRSRRQKCLHCILRKKQLQACVEWNSVSHRAAIDVSLCGPLTTRLQHELHSPRLSVCSNVLLRRGPSEWARVAAAATDLHPVIRRRTTVCPDKESLAAIWLSAAAAGLWAQIHI